MRKFVYQSQEKGCGVACVKMALIECSGVSCFQNLPEPDASHGLTLADLVDYGEEHGLPLSGYRYSNPNDIERIDDFPILLMARRGTTEHMVYVYGRTRRGLLVMDPARGREVWPFEYAKSKSLCIYLAPGKYSPAGEKPPKRRRALPLGYQAGLCFVHMLPPVCFALAASSLTLGYSEWIGLALLGLGIVFAAFIGRMQMGVIRKIDRRLEDALLVQDPGERERRFRHSEAYKKAYLSGFPAFLSSLFLAISLGSIGSLRDPPFFWALLVSSSLSVGAYFVGRRGEKEKIRRIEEAEEDFLSPQAPPRELRKRYRRVKEAVGRLTNSFLLRAGLLSVLGAAVSVAVLHLVGRLGVSPFVSWWLFLTVILTRVEEAKNALKNIEEERKEEAFVLGFLGGFAHERCTSRPQTREYGLE